MKTLPDIRLKLMYVAATYIPSVNVLIARPRNHDSGLRDVILRTDGLVVVAVVVGGPTTHFLPVIKT